MSRLSLVGEAPAGTGTEPAPALEGRAGRTLAEMMQVPDSVYREKTVRRNLFEAPDEGKVWHPGIALERAVRMAGDFRHADHVVLLGSKVAAAFGVAGFEPYEWVSMQRVMTGEVWHAARVPHPSGRNRLLNDPRERERMGRFLREALGDRA